MPTKGKGQFIYFLKREVCMNDDAHNSGPITITNVIVKLTATVS